MKKGSIIAISAIIAAVLVGAGVLVGIFLFVFWFRASSEVANAPVTITYPDMPEGAIETVSSDPRDRRLVGESPTHGVILDVSADGGITVAGESVSSDQLKNVLTTLVNQNENVSVQVRGHPSTPFQSMTEVIEACQQVGILDISFATTASANPPGPSASTPPPTPRNPEIRPKDTTGPVPESLVVQITARGAMRMNGKPTTEERLAYALKAVTKRNPDLKLRVESEEGASERQLAELKNLCKDAGIADISLVKMPARTAE